MAEGLRGRGESKVRLNGGRELFALIIHWQLNTWLRPDRVHTALHRTATPLLLTS